MRDKVRAGVGRSARCRHTPSKCGRRCNGTLRDGAGVDRACRFSRAVRARGTGQIDIARAARRGVRAELDNEGSGPGSGDHRGHVASRNERGSVRHHRLRNNLGRGEVGLVVRLEVELAPAPDRSRRTLRNEHLTRSTGCREGVGRAGAVRRSAVGRRSVGVGAAASDRKQRLAVDEARAARREEWAVRGQLVEARSRRRARLCAEGDLSVDNILDLVVSAQVGDARLPRLRAALVHNVEDADLRVSPALALPLGRAAAIDHALGECRAGVVVAEDDTRADARLGVGSVEPASVRARGRARLHAASGLDGAADVNAARLLGAWHQRDCASRIAWHGDAGTAVRTGHRGYYSTATKTISPSNIN